MIDANELLGSAWMFNKHYDLSEAYHYFQKAMHERFDNPDDYVPKRIVPTDVSMLLDTKECVEIRDLQQIRNDKLALTIEALLVVERILGPKNCHLRNRMRISQVLLLRMNEYTKSINLLLYLTKLKQDNNEDVDVTYFTELFAEMYHHGIRIDFQPLLESFQRVVNEATRDKYRIQNGEPNCQTFYETDILVCMYLIGIMLVTYTCNDEERQMYRAVYHFIQHNPQLQNGFTPLHMCCSSLTNDNNFNLGDHISFPKARICQTLVACGANINTRDMYNNTPLHIISKCKISYVGIHEEIIKCLMENGTHFDTRDINDMTAADVASTKIAETLISNHMKLSLKCLSA